jgi:hypothetical protein
MTLLNQLTDDQIALVSCAGALVGAFAVMIVSYHVGALVRRSGSTSRESRAPDIARPISTGAAASLDHSGRRAA